MTAAAYSIELAESYLTEPGTLRPRAVWAILALFSARQRTASAWWIARVIGDEGALRVAPLLHDMAALGLVERVGRGIGWRARWRLLVEGPAARRIDHRAEVLP